MTLDLGYLLGHKRSGNAPFKLHDASTFEFDNTDTGLSATDLAAVLDELFIDSGLGIYGNEANGALNLVGSVNLAGDVYYTTAATNDFSLSTKNFRVFANISINVGTGGGTIHNNGNSGASGGAGIAVASMSAASTAGAAGGTNANGSNSSNIVIASLGGGGGNGGAASPRTGGTAGFAVAPAASRGTIRLPFQMVTANFWGLNGAATASRIGPATGGGGGAGAAASDVGGRGGGGAGGMLLVAPLIINNGDISCIGGVGQNGVTVTTGAGGGGGGGGGFILIVTRKFSGNTPLVTGGVGGTGTGNGANGANGSNGNYIILAA